VVARGGAHVRARRGRPRLPPTVGLAALLIGVGLLPLSSAAEGAERATDASLLLAYPLFMSYSTPAIHELVEYVGTGLNTVAITVSPGATDDERSRALDLLGACSKRGLPVVVEVGDVLLAEGMRESPFDVDYVAAVREWVAQVVGDLRNRRAICAWTTPPLLCGRYEPNDPDFGAFLQGTYPSIDHLRKSWGIQVTGWSRVRVGQAIREDPARPGGFGPAALDYAAYRAAAYRSLASLWLSAIAEADRSRPVFIGREVSRAAFACGPEPCAGIVADAGPEELVSGWQDALPALAAARRGGSREVILGIPPSPDILRNAHLMFVCALASGARGVAFGEWQAVARNALLKKAMASCAAGARAIGDAPFRPLPSAAILHEPFADGTVLPDGSGLYGFLAGISPGEPSQLASTYSIGHRYGLVDFIGVDALERGELSRYSVLLAPACFDMPKEASTALLDWVNGGGVAVLDIGAGMRQSGSLLLLSPGLEMVAGIARLGRVASMPGSFVFVDAPPPLIHLPVGERAVGVDGGPVFTGLVGGALLGLAAQPIADAGSWRGPDQRFYQSGIILNRFGRGFCVFATGPLFANWDPTDPSYGALFDDLLAIGARTECEPAKDARPLADDLMATVGETGLVVVNLRDEARQPLVRVAAPVGQVFAGAWRRCAKETLAEPRSSEVYVSLPPLGLARAVPLPVYVEGETWATASRCDPDRLELEVRPAAADLVCAGGELTVQNRGHSAVPIRLRVEDGPYRVRPNSVHRLAYRDPQGRVHVSAEVRADRSGVLSVDIVLDGDTLIVSPDEAG